MSNFEKDNDFGTYSTVQEEEQEDDTITSQPEENVEKTKSTTTLYDNNEINERLNLYYKLKSNYDSIHSDINIENKNKKDKSKYTKQKCLNCKRPVGSIFKTTFNKETSTKTLNAKCGDTVNPCLFNIEIIINPVYLLDKKIREEQQSLSEIQMNIIKIKNDLLYGYIQEEEAIQKFENYKNDIEEKTIQLDEHITKLLSVTNNEERLRNDKIYKTEVINNVDTFKFDIKEFERTRNKTHIQNANLFYRDELLPSLKKLRENKYVLNTITRDTKSLVEDDYLKEKYMLTQQEYTTEMIEDTMGKNRVEIVHFVLGNSMSGGNIMIGGNKVSMRNDKKNKSYHGKTISIRNMLRPNPHNKTVKRTSH